MSDLDKKPAYVGFGVIAIAILLAILLQASPSVGGNSTFLLFVSQALACGCGFFVLLGQLRNASRPVRVAAMTLACIVGGGLITCFVMAVGSNNVMRLTGQGFGITISLVMFFLFAGGIDDILTTTRQSKHVWGVLIWFVNITAMVIASLMWASGHLQASDQVLTNAYMVSYVGLCTTKYISLAITSTHGSRKVKGVFAMLIAITVILGWLYIGDLTHPGWILNSTLFANAAAFGTAYGLDSVLRDKKDFPQKEFIRTVLLQVVIMAAVAIAGRVLPGNKLLIVGLLCMETLPNLPGGGISLITDLFKKRPEGQERWYRSTGLLFLYEGVFGVMVCGAIVACAFAIIFQAYAVPAGAVTIAVLQSIPWMRVGLRACRDWAEKPGKALGWLITALLCAGVICGGLAVWLSARGGLSETDLTASWYTIARVISMVGLSFFGFLGIAVARRNAQNTKAWQYLLIAIITAIGFGFLWFLVALYTGGIEATIAPGLLMQVAGSVLVVMFYPQFNSSQFRASADEETV